jgi:hypothetical protein
MSKNRLPIVLGGVAVVLIAAASLISLNTRPEFEIDNWRSFEAYNAFNALVDAGDRPGARRFAEQGYQAGGGLFYAHTLGRLYLTGYGGDVRFEQGLSLMSEAAQHGEWTARFDYAVWLLRLVQVPVDAFTTSRPVPTTAMSRRSERFSEALVHLRALAAEDYAPALLLIWRLGLGGPESEEWPDALDRAAALGHPTAELASLRLRAGGGDRVLCQHDAALRTLAASGQVEAAWLLSQCLSRERHTDPDAAVEALSWILRVEMIVAERSHFGSLTGEEGAAEALKGRLAEPMTDATRTEAEAEARQWLEDVYDPAPPQCQEICFSKERGFYPGPE